MTNINIKELIKICITNEILKLETVKNDISIELLKKYNFDTIENQSTKINNLKDINQPLLYIIKINSNLKIEDVTKAKKECSKNDFAMFKINKDNFLEQFDKKIKYLYVGSSHNIKKRLIEHMGVGGSKKTYALHLKQWFKEQIEIEVYKTKNEYLQLFEDIMWDIYKPLLGKRGKK